MQPHVFITYFELSLYIIVLHFYCPQNKKGFKWPQPENVSSCNLFLKSFVLKTRSNENCSIGFFNMFIFLIVRDMHVENEP